MPAMRAGEEWSYVDNAFDLTENGGHRGACEGHLVDDAGFSDDYIQENLMHVDEFAEGVEDGIAIGSAGDGRHALHSRDRLGSSCNDIGEPGDDFLRDGAGQT
jgi:hypothetical protein